MGDRNDFCIREGTGANEVLKKTVYAGIWDIVPPNKEHRDVRIKLTSKYPPCS